MPAIDSPATSNVSNTASRALPAAVGITIGRDGYLLPYLLGAAELAVAVLSFGCPTRPRFG